MSRIVSESEFSERLRSLLAGLSFGCVTGPGRSGAVASVYASHFLGIPWIPYGQPLPWELAPLLIIDTAVKSGATLRKAERKYGAEVCTVLAVYQEPPRVKFWYELQANRLADI